MLDQTYCPLFHAICYYLVLLSMNLVSQVYSQIYSHHHHRHYRHYRHRHRCHGYDHSIVITIVTAGLMS